MMVSRVIICVGLVINASISPLISLETRSGSGDSGDLFMTPWPFTWLRQKRCMLVSAASLYKSSESEEDIAALGRLYSQ